MLKWLLEEKVIGFEKTCLLGQRVLWAPSPPHLPCPASGETRQLPDSAAQINKVGGGYWASGGGGGSLWIWGIWNCLFFPELSISSSEPLQGSASPCLLPLHSPQHPEAVCPRVPGSERALCRGEGRRTQPGIGMLPQTPVTASR